MTFLGWLSDLQLGDEKGTLNHLVVLPFFLNKYIFSDMKNPHPRKTWTHFQLNEGPTTGWLIQRDSVGTNVTFHPDFEGQSNVGKSSMLNFLSLGFVFFLGGVVDVFTDWDCTMGWIRHHFSPPCTSKSKVTLIDLESPFFHRTHLGGIFWFRFIECPVFRSGSLKWDEHHLWKKPGWLKKVREVMILFPGVERLGGPFKSYPPLKEGWVLQHV